MVSCSVAGGEYVRWPLKVAKKKRKFEIIFARLKFGGMTVGMMRNKKNNSQLAVERGKGRPLGHQRSRRRWNVLTRNNLIALMHSQYCKSCTIWEKKQNPYYFSAFRCRYIIFLALFPFTGFWAGKEWMRPSNYTYGYNLQDTCIFMYYNTFRTHIIFDLPWCIRWWYLTIFILFFQLFLRWWTIFWR